MNIIIYGDVYFSTDMAWGFKELNHTVQTIFPKTRQEMDTLLTQTQPDILITMGSPIVFPPDVLAYLGNRPNTTTEYVHWDTDGITWVDIEMKHIQLMQPDIVFTVCPQMHQILENKGIPCHMLPYAFNPTLHHPGPADPKMEGQITFVGAAYAEVIHKYPDHYRRRSMDILFRPLLDTGYRIDFYGEYQHKQVIKSLYDFDVPNAWLHGRFPYRETCLFYNSCHINLVTQNHEHALTKRTFEILGSGGFALSLDTSAVHEFFIPGKDLVVSSSPGQTLDIVSYYQHHPDEYEKIRKNAPISVQNHTYKQRAEAIIGKLS